MDLTTMNLRNLIYFKRVAEVQHLTKAAKSLYISQGYLSKIIDEMERELGVKLFDRAGRGLKLNDSGEAFLEYARVIIRLSNEAAEHTRLAYQNENHHIRLATNAGGYLPNTLVECAKRLPSLRLMSTTAPRSVITTWLREGRVSLLFTAPPITADDFDSCVLFEETAVVIYPEGHWLSGRSSVSINELINEKCVGWAKGFGPRDVMEAAFNSQKYPLNYILETESTTSVKECVRAGVGIAFAAKAIFALDPFFRNHFCYLEGDIPAQISLCWRRGYVFNDFESEFFSVLKRYFAELERKNRKFNQ